MEKYEIILGIAGSILMFLIGLIGVVRRQTKDKATIDHTLLNHGRQIETINLKIEKLEVVSDRLQRLEDKVDKNHEINAIKLDQTNKSLDLINENMAGWQKRNMETMTAIGESILQEKRSNTDLLSKLMESDNKKK